MLHLRLQGNTMEPASPLRKQSGRQPKRSATTSLRGAPPAPPARPLRCATGAEHTLRAMPRLPRAPLS
jgi:hypothetical protein